MSSRRMVARAKVGDLYSDKNCWSVRNGYRGDPIGFMTEIGDVDPKHVWPKMVEMAESVRDNQRTCVFAGHSVSKDYTAARIALWFLCSYGDRCSVIITGPGNNQVENIFWREFCDAYNSARQPIGGRLTTCRLELDDKWVALAFVTNPDVMTNETTRFQGFHNRYVLLIFTEAAGIPSSTWRAGETLIVSPRDRWLVYGNPTSAYGSFADCEDDPAWHFIRISVLDTPNYKEGKEIIPGVSGRHFEQTLRKYGVESAEYGIRILGRKPQYSEGTFYGTLVADAKQAGRITEVPVDPLQPVHTFHDVGDVYTAIWFAQITGSAENYAIRCVDFYYDYEGKGLPEYAGVIKSKGYRLGRHFVPPDVLGSNRQNYQTGRATMDVAREYGLEFEVLDFFTPEAAHNAARQMLPFTVFDGERCREGVAMVANYRKQRNERLSAPDRPVYHETPIKDSNSHGATAFEHLALAVKYTDLLERQGGLPERTDGGRLAPDAREALYEALARPGAVDDFSDVFGRQEEIQLRTR